MSHPVVMRCNVGPSVGIGHLMRCRELARRLAAMGHESHILGPPQSLRQPEDATLFASWTDVPDRGTSADDLARVLALCSQTGARHLNMDDYRIDPDYQQGLKGAGLRWLQQFDAGRPWDFHAPLIVNASPYEERHHYARYLKAPGQQQTLFGPAYAVLRRDFAQVTPRTPGRPVERILVAFGGGDDRGAIALALDALKGLPVSPVVVSGPGNPRNTENRALAGAAEYHIGPADLPALMVSCDLALIGGGTMSYEAAICALPLILMPLAPNQLRPCRGWANRADARLLSGPETAAPDEIRATVEALRGDHGARRSMAEKGLALVDGKGADRLLEALLEGAAP